MTSFMRGIRSLPQGIRNAIEWLLPYDEGSADRTFNPLMEALAPRTSAEIRARRLLLRLLTRAQRGEFLRHGHFTVQVHGRGGFRVLPRTMFNVLDPRTRTCYCAGPESPLPLSDLMLAQKLILENDPERFFRVARYRREQED
jgi:hypothetical protein